MNLSFQNCPKERKEVLFKLLCLEPETLDELVKVTGWGREATQSTLLQLVVDGRVVCRNGGGRRMYRIKSQ